MGRAPCCDKANVKKGPWSPEEDAKLKAYIDKYGTGGNWIALPQKIGLKRCGKSCRLRWLNYLRPNIKHGGFTEEEDNIILSLYISIGSRWSIIAAQLPGRTDNDIKNYWNTRLKKKLLGRRKQQQQQHNGVHGSKEELPSLSSSALERLQLHMQLHGQQDGLQNPLSLFNNSAIWPKLHPLIQEKLIQNNLQSLTPHQMMLQYPNFNNNNNIEFMMQPTSSVLHLQEGRNNNNSNNKNDGMVMIKDNHVEEMEISSFNGSSTSSGSSHAPHVNMINPNNDDNINNESTKINNDTNNNMGKFVVGLNNNNVSKIEGYSTGMQRVLSFQAELNELLGANNDHKVGNYDIEGINGWWSNDSSSANCWDASTVVLQPEDSPTMLYNHQDYA